MRLTGGTSQAVGYILEHIGENPTLDQVAEHCHFSKFYFSRRFKAETGESPCAFIRRARLERSAFRLKTEPGRTVTDIGWDCGYSSSNYSTVFRRRFGARPVDFRRTALQSSFRHPFCHYQGTAGLDALSELPGGLHLVYPFRGPVRQIYTAYQVLFNFWLPQAGRRLSDLGSYDLYRVMGGPDYVEMDICLPLDV